MQKICPYLRVYRPLIFICSTKQVFPYDLGSFHSTIIDIGRLYTVKLKLNFMKSHYVPGFYHCWNKNFYLFY